MRLRSNPIELRVEFAQYQDHYVREESEHPI
jgi:hypothetical protein